MEHLEFNSVSEMNQVRGVIPCGGKGTRLRPLSHHFQKAMVPIGPQQRPLLEHIVRLLRYHGITDIVLLVGYKHQQIVNHFDDGTRFNVRITYVHDGSSLRGTGGALLNAYEQGIINTNQTLLIYYGDIPSSINLTEMLQRHRKTGAIATLAVAKGYKIPVGVVRIKEDEKVTSFTEKPILDMLVDIGIFVLEGKSLTTLQQLGAKTKNLDLMGHLFPRLLADRKPVYAYIIDAFWYDAGSIERYEKLDDNVIKKCLAGL